MALSAQEKHNQIKITHSVFCTLPDDTRPTNNQQQDTLLTNYFTGI